MAFSLVPEAVLFHIPHSSTVVPDLSEYSRPDLIAGEIELLTDWDADRIFDHPGVERLIAPYSRVFCDVERFEDDADEPMAARGMGFYYTHTDAGVSFREPGAGRAKVLERYYRPHHRRLAEAVQIRLDRHKRCLLVDCHTFTAAPHQREPDQGPDRPDICLGTQGSHTPGPLVEVVRRHFASRGLSVALDRPYSGSMVPLAYLDQDYRVASLMIEINQKLYRTGGATDQSAVADLRRMVSEIIDELCGSTNPWADPGQIGT